MLQYCWKIFALLILILQVQCSVLLIDRNPEIIQTSDNYIEEKNHLVKALNVNNINCLLGKGPCELNFKKLKSKLTFYGNISFL